VCLDHGSSYYSWFASVMVIEAIVTYSMSFLCWAPAAFYAASYPGQKFLFTIYFCLNKNCLSWHYLNFLFLLEIRFRLFPESGCNTYWNCCSAMLQAYARAEAWPFLATLISVCFLKLKKKTKAKLRADSYGYSFSSSELNEHPGIWSRARNLQA